MVTESFAGPHDSANAPWFYSQNGLIRDLSGTNVFALDLATNYTSSLAFASPFAAGPIYEQLNMGAYQNFSR